MTDRAEYIAGLRVLADLLEQRRRGSDVMTGHEHYTEAEQLLREAADAHPADASLLLSFAQVHATLALAAVTADTHRPQVVAP
jgi:hypothetical protein